MALSSDGMHTRTLPGTTEKLQGPERNHRSIAHVRRLDAMYLTRSGLIIDSVQQYGGRTSSAVLIPEGGREGQGHAVPGAK